jgi:hypothetical protein
MAKWKFKKVTKLEDVPEPYRALYVEKDDGFEVDPAKFADFEFDDREEVAGALEHERTERKRLKTEVDKYKGIDPEKARAAQARLDELDEQNLIQSGEVEKLKAKWQKDWDDEKADLVKQIGDRDGQLTKFKLTDRVREAALNAGVHKEKVEDTLLLTERHFKLGEGDKIVVLDKDGLESRSDLDKFFGEEFKTQKPWLYEATGAGGSGAPAGGSGGGTGGAKTVKRAEFEQKTPAERATMAKEGVTVVD